MIRFYFTRLFILFFFLVLLAGCGTDPTTGSTLVEGQAVESQGSCAGRAAPGRVACTWKADSWHAASTARSSAKTAR